MAQTDRQTNGHGDSMTKNIWLVEACKQLNYIQPVKLSQSTPERYEEGKQSILLEVACKQPNLYKDLHTLHVFVLILATKTLGPKFTHFLFTNEEINYIYGTLEQFRL